jgi:hypothetical protein
VQYGNASATARTADGTSGVLCRSADGASWFFRVYASDGSFTDFDLHHDELSITIMPGAKASFYERDGMHVLDHSPAVLGLQSIEDRGSEE